ncbi:MAG: hypothetical protein HYX39_09875 [Bacteroidetes bacterium]|nr:hypothetical protein [Bacteroidota bacterium]
MSPEEEQKDLQADLERFMALHGIITLQEVIAIAPAQLLKMEGFGYRILNYLIGMRDKINAT